MEARKTIAVAMNGRESSLACAYLLKKQGYDIVGVSLIFDDKDRGISVSSRCISVDREIIQAQCDALSIPLYFVDARTEFENTIWSTLVSQKIMGEGKQICSECHAFRIKILLSKIGALGINVLATGHYAKTVLGAEEVVLMRAQDLESDESALLIRLDSGDLEHVKFPLGDISKAEVEKLILSLKIKYWPSAILGLRCYENQKVLFPYIKSHVADSFIRTGEFFDLDDGHLLGTHEGVAAYSIAQSNLVDYNGSAMHSSYKVARFDHARERVLLTKNEGVVFDYIWASSFKGNLDLNLSRPILAFLILSEHESATSCYVYFKSLDHLCIFMSKTQRKFLSIGQDLVFYNKEGAQAKIIGHAKLLHFGLWSPLDRTQGHIQPNELIGPELSKSDFNF